MFARRHYDCDTYNQNNINFRSPESENTDSPEVDMVRPQHVDMIVQIFTGGRLSRAQRLYSNLIQSITLGGVGTDTLQLLPRALDLVGEHLVGAGACEHGQKVTGVVLNFNHLAKLWNVLLVGNLVLRILSTTRR